MNRRELLRTSALAALAGGATPSFGFAADPPSGDAMIRQYLANETKRLSAKFLDGATTKEEWAKTRDRLKGEFLYMLGLDPAQMRLTRTPLKAAVTGTLERGNVTIEKLHYQSRPGLYVTVNLYLPKGAAKRDEKLPAILYVCGHSNMGRDGNKTAFQDHGMWFASNGYVCLVVDTLQLGEIAGKHHGTYNLGRFWWHSRGYTPAGVECWNGVRGIDYLCSLPYVDAEKIGVTGISGGGATTNWIIAADDRVKVGVPVSGVSDLQCYVTDQVINGHCDCMFFHNLYQWEWTTALALFAPKPLLFANSDNDGIFPMSGNKRIIERLRKCYKMLGAEEKVDEHVSKGGHAYREDLRVAIFQFFHKHLKGDKVAVKDTQFEKIDGKDLRVFPEDKDIPKDAINATADETFVPVAKVELPSPDDFRDWKSKLTEQLSTKLFVNRTLPRDKDRVLELGDGKRAIALEEGVYSALGPETKAGADKKKPVAWVFLNPDDDAEVEFNRWTKRFTEVRHLRTMYTRGGGPLRWTQKNPPNTVERSLVLLGQTVDSGRLWDVSQVLATSSGFRPGMIIAARGQAGIIAAYAAIFEPKVVSEIVILDPPASHRDGPHFLGVQRVLDIPEALGLLAPDVKLTLVGKSAKDKAFDRTAAIYKAAGAEDKFTRE